MSQFNALLILISISLTGCSLDLKSKPSTKTGVLLDSPVANISYKTETLEGATNALGEYQYVEGEKVTFFIGSLVFPSVPATDIVTPFSIAETQDFSNSRVVNIVRLLQTLDQDGNPDNGITIADTAKNAATPVDFSLSESDFEKSAAVLNLVANSGSTNVSLVSKEDAIAHFKTTLSNTPLSSDKVIDLPEQTINIDGDKSDWVGVQPIGLDKTGDQNGASSTDLVKVSIARSGETIALLMETAGDINLYHTSGSAYSHYEIGFHFHSNSECSRDDNNGFFIVNNFTDANNQNYHRLEGWFNDATLKDIESENTNQQTMTAHAGTVLETSFSLSLLPKDKGGYISLSSYVQSFKDSDGTSVRTKHDALDSNVCFKLPVQ